MIQGKITIDLTPLDGLKRAVVSKILRKATTQAAKCVKTAVVGNAQETQRFGYLAKSIGVKVRIYKDTAVAVVGPRSKWTKTKAVRTRGKNKGEAVTIRPSYYAHLVERGSKRSQAHPFLKPALDSQREQYFSLLSQAITQGIAEQLAKTK